MGPYALPYFTNTKVWYLDLRLGPDKIQARLKKFSVAKIAVVA